MLHVEANLLEKIWLSKGEAIDLIEQHWNEPIRHVDGTRMTILSCECPEESEAVPFQRLL
ncbi:MAG TPA: hypothetical protein VFY04_07640 [Solirubrobacterales bacterium]|nr:hypothetical protein [Solirubrobacterales bacterium]